MTFINRASIKITILSILTFVSGFSCVSDKQKPIENDNTSIAQTAALSIPDNLSSGQIYEHLAINQDELNSFALYLPKLYTSSNTWPIVFFFDAGGNGALPIKKYQSLADSLGYIFVGSNVSKNGQTLEETFLMWNTLKNSIINNFAIAKNRIILAGFSGGARVCCAIASKEPGIQGIIANSAGATNLEQLLSPTCLFIGICGKGDMNRAEMLGIEQHLSTTVFPHFNIEFDGIHEWAPIKTMKKAFTLATLQSYNKSPGLLNPDLLSNFIVDQQKEIDNLKLQNNLLGAYHELMLLTRATKGLTTVSIEDPDSLKNNPIYLAQKNEFYSLNAKETATQQELYKLMLENPDLSKWKLKIDQIRKNSLAKNSTGQMHQRLLGYASLVCYSLSNRNLVAKNYMVAEQMINCYEIADPKNAEVYFFKAIISGAKENKVDVVQNLKKAIQLELTDKSRIKQQMEFNFLKNDSEFIELMK
jgi:hypothetical protein